jgi:hypothetical protein
MQKYLSELPQKLTRHSVTIVLVGNIVVIDVKDKGRLQMSEIKIARWRLLEILFLDF